MAETVVSSFAGAGAGMRLRSGLRGEVLKGIAFSTGTLKSWQIRRHSQQARRNHDAGRRSEAILPFLAPASSNMGLRGPKASASHVYRQSAVILSRGRFARAMIS